MKLTILREDLPEPDLLLRCKDPEAPEVLALLRYLEEGVPRLAARAENGPLLLPPSEVLYGEFVGRGVFLCTAQAVYPSPLSLERLSEADACLFRCSKSMVVNLRHIRSLQAESSGRILASLSNGERILISRHFAASLRRRLQKG